MKSILLIGLGRFGRHIAIHLNELKHQVMAVDHVEERVDAVLPYVTNAQIGDSTNAAFLESLGIRNYDVCIVAIGNDFQSSLKPPLCSKSLAQKWWYPGRPETCRQSSFCATVQMRWFTLKSNLPNGQPSVTALTTF